MNLVFALGDVQFYFTPKIDHERLHLHMGNVSSGGNHTVPSDGNTMTSNLRSGTLRDARIAPKPELSVLTIWSNTSIAQELVMRARTLRAISPLKPRHLHFARSSAAPAVRAPENAACPARPPY